MSESMVGSKRLTETEEENGANVETPWEPASAEDVLQYLRDNLVNSFADADFRETLLFDDNLVGDHGGYRVSVAESLWDGKPCFVVEGHSHGIANGVKWKLQLTATVEIPSLGTVRQKRVFIAESCVEDGAEDEPLDVVECLTTVEMLKRPFTPVEEPAGNAGEGEDEDEPKLVGEGGENAEEPPPIPMHVTYQVTKALKHHDDREESERVLTEEESSRFFPDGALVILLRCLVKLRFENLSIPLRLLDFDPEFELCEQTCLRGENANVAKDGREEEEEEAYRFCVEHARSDGVVYATETRHLASGQAVYRRQDEPFLELFWPESEEPTREKESKESIAIVKPVFPKSELVMEEDLELFSKYQDRMDELKASHGTYLRQHPELQTILADFLQEVLTMKPAQFMPFAASYFSTFGQQDSGRPSRSSKQKSITPSSAPSRPVSPRCTCEHPEPFTGSDLAVGNVD